MFLGGYNTTFGHFNALLLHFPYGEKPSQKMSLRINIAILWNIRIYSLSPNWKIAGHENIPINLLNQ